MPEEENDPWNLNLPDLEEYLNTPKIEQLSELEWVNEIYSLFEKLDSFEKLEEAMKYFLKREPDEIDFVRLFRELPTIHSESKAIERIIIPIFGHGNSNLIYNAVDRYLWQVGYTDEEIKEFKNRPEIYLSRKSGIFKSETGKLPEEVTGISELYDLIKKSETKNKTKVGRRKGMILGELLGSLSVGTSDSLLGIIKEIGENNDNYWSEEESKAAQDAYQRTNKLIEEKRYSAQVRFKNTTGKLPSEITNLKGMGTELNPTIIDGKLNPIYGTAIIDYFNSFSQKELAKKTSNIYNEIFKIWIETGDKTAAKTIDKIHN